MFDLDSLTKEYLETLRARELYQIAREINVIRYTRYKKQELVDAILEMKNQGSSSTPKINQPKEETSPKTTKQVRTKKISPEKENEKAIEKVGEKAKTVKTKNQNLSHEPVAMEPLREPIERKPRIERKTTPPMISDEPYRSSQEMDSERKSYIEERNRTQERAQMRTPEREPRSHSSTSNEDYSMEKGDSSQSAEYRNPHLMARGVLDIHADGYGFLRSAKYIPDVTDVYVHPSLIKKLGLRPGDFIEGRLRGPRNEKEKYSALTSVDLINKAHPTTLIKRPRFEDLIPIFPLERFHLAGSVETSNITNRLIELVSPLGKGQRGMIVSPPKAGKTTVIKRIAQGISKNNPEAYLMILLIDERPEEVTDMKRSVKADIISSTFDQLPENHIRVVELAIQRAKRLVEMKKDVVILLDGITRLTRAYNLSVTPSGRTLTGGLDTAAIHGPKKFLGAARNIDEGGSLTILATALIETGSKMDEIIYEEFKGTGNMELVLDRKLAEKRIFPALDITRSSTRREELLYDGDELKRIWMVRKFLSNLENSEAMERLIKWLKESPSNEKFLESISIQAKPTKV